MARVNFNLKDPGSKEPTLIFLVFRYSGKRFKYSTGKKVYPMYWDHNKHRIKTVRKYPHYVKINIQLNNLESKILDTYEGLLAKSLTPTNHLLKKAYLKPPHLHRHSLFYQQTSRLI